MVCTTLAILVVPVVLDLLVHGARRVFGYLAIDAFYYLTVARNGVDLGGLTFDHVHATNGYHPLWQWVCVALFGVARGVGGSELTFLVLSVLLGLLLIAAAVVLVGIAMRRAHGRVSPWLMLIVPGVVALASTPLYQSAHDFKRLRGTGSTRAVVGTLWRYANGMESGLVLLAFAALLLVLVVRPRPQTAKDGLVLGGVAGLVTLARLDHGVFAVAVLAGVVTVALLWGERSMRRAAMVAALAFVAVLGLYLLYNDAVFGSAFPVSGARKSTFPRLSNGNLDKVIELLTEPKGRWVGMAWREWQLVVPPLLAMGYLVHSLRLRRHGPAVGLELRPGRSAFDRALVLFVPGLMVLAAYDFCFVRPNHQGHWYFPVSVVLSSLFVIRMLDRTVVTRTLVRRRWAMAAWLLLWAVGGAAYFQQAHHRPKLNDDVARYVLDEGPKIRAYYRDGPGDPEAAFIEFYDAAFAAATGLPTMNGYGLVLDDEAHEALDDGRGALVELAISRGYDRVVSFNCRHRLGKKPKRGSLQRYLKRYLSKEFLEDYDLVLEYMSKDRRTAVIRLVPRTTEG